jgi:homoaconitase/3-isopropylmalate dehydratase large subunit
LTINYIDQNEYDAAHAAAEVDAAYLETIIISSSEINNTFTMPTSVSNVFIENTEQALSIFDDHNKTLYREFMESIVDV